MSPQTVPIKPATPLKTEFMSRVENFMSQNTRAMTGLQSQMSVMVDRLDGLEHRMGNLEHRMGNLERISSRIEAGLSRVEDTLNCGIAEMYGLVYQSHISVLTFYRREFFVQDRLRRNPD